MSAPLPAPFDPAIQTYHDSGYLHLPGLIPASEIAEIATAIDRLPAEHADLIAPQNLRFEFHEGRVWKWDPVTDVCPAIAALVQDPRITRVLRKIYDGRAPQLFKDKLIIKPAGSRGNDLHQDYNWWQGFPKSLLTVVIAIDAGTHANGCTAIYPGMHTQGLLHAPGSFQIPDSAVAGHTPAYFESQPGDVAIFHCMTPHRAGVNSSDRPRRQLFISYNDSRDGDLYAAHYRHFGEYRRSYLQEAERGAYYQR